MNNQYRNEDGLTAYQWGREFFEFENCHECGKGVRGHIIARGIFGEFHAFCKKGGRQIPESKYLEVVS